MKKFIKFIYYNIKSYLNNNFWNFFKGNNQYIYLIIKFLDILIIDIKDLKKKWNLLINFTFSLNLLQKLLLIYFFFIGVIPIILIIFFWITFSYYILYYFLLFIDIFFFKFSLIYFNNNIVLLKYYSTFKKINMRFIFIFKKLFKYNLNLIYILLNILTFKWWQILLNKYIIKPLDKLLCFFLDRILFLLSKIFKYFSNIFKKIINTFSNVKGSWTMNYKERLKGLIKSIRLLKFYRFNLVKYFTIILWLFIKFKFCIKILFNKWFWLFYLKLYFYDILIRKYIILICYSAVHLLYILKNIIFKITYYFKNIKNNIFCLTNFLIFNFIKIYYFMILNYYFIIFKIVLINNIKIFFNIIKKYIVFIYILNSYLRILNINPIIDITINNIKIIYISMYYKYIYYILKLNYYYIIKILII